MTAARYTPLHHAHSRFSRSDPLFASQTLDPSAEPRLQCWLPALLFRSIEVAAVRHRDQQAVINKDISDKGSPLQMVGNRERFPQLPAHIVYLPMLLSSELADCRGRAVLAAFACRPSLSVDRSDSRNRGASGASGAGVNLSRPRSPGRTRVGRSGSSSGVTSRPSRWSRGSGGCCSRRNAQQSPGSLVR